MDLELEGCNVLVAGGTRGIGLAVARGFVEEGARVALVGRTAGDVEAARAELVAAASADAAHGIVADLRQPADVERAVTEAIAQWSGLDAVICVLGSGRGRRGWELRQDDWSASLDQNVVGPMLVASAALPHLIERHGSLTFVSSIAGREALDAPIAYGAAKSALEAAMKYLSRLAGPEGVRVNAVAPGNVLFPGGSWAHRLESDPEGVERYIERAVPLKRFATPAEIADAVLFLASARAAFVTGATLVVDGGQTTAF